MIEEDNRRLVCLVSRVTGLKTNWSPSRAPETKQIGTKVKERSILEHRLFYSPKTVECLVNVKNQKITIGY